MPYHLRKFLKTFHGSSFPTLAETVTGEKYVIKMRGAGNGAASLVSEYMVNRLAHSAGLPVPDATVLVIRSDHPWEFGTDEFDDLLQKSAGANLGLEWIEGLAPLHHADLPGLPHDLVSQVITLDTAFLNYDRTLYSLNLVKDARGREWILDHGSCRFLFSPSFRPGLPPGHALSNQAHCLDAKWLAAMTPHLIAGIADSIPEEWLSECGLTALKVTHRTVTAIQHTVELALNFRE